MFDNGMSINSIISCAHNVNVVHKIRIINKTMRESNKYLNSVSCMMDSIKN